MLIEILVSAMVLTIASAGVVMLLQTTTKTQAEQRHNTEAYALAQEDQARLASLRLSVLNRLDETRTVTLNKTNFQVRSRGVFINDSTSTPSCGEGTSTADYVEITSSVSWNGMDPGEKAKIVSVLSPSNGSLDPNHGTIAFSVKTQLQEPVPNVYVSGGGGAFGGYTDAAGCAVFADLPAGNYTATVSGSGTGMVTTSGEDSEEREITVVGGDTKTESFELAPPGTIPVNFKYRDGTSPSSYLAAKAPAIVAYNAGMNGGTAKTIWSPTGEPVPSINAEQLFPFSSSYYLYAGSCSANNPEPEENPAYAAATANVVAPVGGTAPAATLQLPVLDLLVTKNGSPFAGATVTVTMADSSCKTPQGAPVRRTYTTGSDGRIANGEGEPATLPWGRYDLCAQGYVSGNRRDRDDDVDVKSLTGPTAHTINLTSNDQSGFC